MRIHRAELRHVRQIKELVLDLSAPLTVIAGANGVGKTTVQQAILAAMFHLRSKDARDSFISRFDPDSAPSVTLALSHGESSPTIVLSRTLTDDKGEWQEGATILKKKGQALQEIQKVLPISADAAALLLWGRQDDMATVIDEFPSDGHSLLTTATIKGAGPDPKEMIAELDKEIEHAKKGERGGKTVGGFTAATREVARLAQELADAQAAEQELHRHKTQFAQAKIERDRIKNEARDLETEVAKLERLDKLLEPALHDSTTLNSLVELQTDQGTLEEEIAQARKALAEAHKERERLQCQYRVARHRELTRQIDALRGKIEAVDKLEQACAALEKDLASKKRPEAGDAKRLRELHSEVRQIEARIEASGVRYELSLVSGTRAVRLAEDGATQEITVSAGRARQGIVGRLEIEIDGLRLSAVGKEDIAGQRHKVKAKTAEIEALLAQFAAKDEAALVALAEEKSELDRQLLEKRNEVKLQFAGASAESLKTQLPRLEQARTDAHMTLQDEEACAGKDLAAAAEIEKRVSRKDGEIEAGEEALESLEKKRPSDLDKRMLANNVEAFRKKARASAAAFKDADEAGREPTAAFHEQVKTGLPLKRAQQARLNAERLEAERKVAGLEGQLRQANPHRGLDTIEADLQDARAALRRQEVLQDARALLRERIDATMTELAKHVPLELGERITQCLSRLTDGLFHRVSLSEQLRVTHVSENGSLAEQWQPAQLSFGERHQAALAVKIAVARALAETSPVFIILDDSLVSFDPDRRKSTEELLLSLVADAKLQVILLTCHTDWAADWRKRQPKDVTFIELARRARYYRERRGGGAGTG